jgi:sugar phosphate isomerase/epimerase
MPSHPFHLGVVADEISDLPEQAFPVARDLGLHEVELQRLWGKSIVDLNGAEIDRARQLLARYDLRVSMISTGLFKTCRIDLIPGGDFERSADFAQHMEALSRAVVMARAFDCRLVRTFSFRWPHMVDLGNPSPRLPHGGHIPPPTLDLIRDGLRIPARLAEREALTLGLENVRSCYGNTGENARIIIDAVDSPALKAVWDPANSFVSGGVDYPDGYEAIRPHMTHVHFKDARVRDAATGLTSWECIGEGEVRLRENLAAFVRDGYSGVVSVETHWRPEDGSNGTPAATAGLRRLLEDIQ